MQLDPGKRRAARLLADPISPSATSRGAQEYSSSTRDAGGRGAGRNHHPIDREVNPPQVAAAEPEPVAEESAGAALMFL